MLTATVILSSVVLDLFVIILFWLSTHHLNKYQLLVGWVTLTLTVLSSIPLPLLMGMNPEFVWNMGIDPMILNQAWVVLLYAAWKLWYFTGYGMLCVNVLSRDSDPVRYSLMDCFKDVFLFTRWRTPF